MAGDPVKAALIESFVRYAREIDATVCAEGIETLADLARLADLDVAYGQGYGIAPPGGRRGRPCRRRGRHVPDLLRGDPSGHAIAGGETQDRLLEELAARLAMADSEGDLRAVLGPIARELHADAVRLATPQEILAEPATGWDRDGRRAGPGPARTWSRRSSTIRSLPAPAAAALAAHGYRSRLLVPVHTRGAVLGTLEAYSVAAEARAWSRSPRESRRATHASPTRSAARSPRPCSAARGARSGGREPLGGAAALPAPGPEEDRSVLARSSTYHPASGDGIVAGRVARAERARVP